MLGLTGISDSGTAGRDYIGLLGRVTINLHIAKYEAFIIMSIVPAITIRSYNQTLVTALHNTIQ